MEIDAEIDLESAPEPAEGLSTPDQRALPFSFAKRHGVLIREFLPDAADAVYRPGASPLSIAEARRFAGVPLNLSRVSQEVFDALLQTSYEQGSHNAMHMVDGLDDDVDLNRVAQELQEPSDLLESDDDAPITSTPKSRDHWRITFRRQAGQGGIKKMLSVYCSMTRRILKRSSRWELTPS